MSNSKVVLVDAHALIHRAFHALPSSLTTSEGVPINAVYGFTRILFRVLEDLKPSYVAIAFDTKAPTFRHFAYKEYKSHRPPAPDDLKVQFPLVRKVVIGLDLQFFAVDGYEADDLLGSLVDLFKSKLKASEIYIVTGDWDTAQLVDGQVKIYTLKKKINDTVIFGETDIQEKFHLTPDQIIDFKALKGDPSDNIPGVKGVGDKTAVYLLKKYKTLDEIYNRLEELEPKYRKKLEPNRENAFLSRDLATISRDVSLNFELEKCVWKGWNKDKVLSLLEEFGFNSLKYNFLKKRNNSNLKKKENNGQLSLV